MQGMFECSNLPSHKLLCIELPVSGQLCWWKTQLLVQNSGCFLGTAPNNLLNISAYKTRLISLRNRDYPFLNIFFGSFLFWTIASQLSTLFETYCPLMHLMFSGRFEHLLPREFHRFHFNPLPISYKNFRPFSAVPITLFIGGWWCIHFLFVPQLLPNCQYGTETAAVRV